jgi:hypothetical protein
MLITGIGRQKGDGKILQLQTEDGKKTVKKVMPIIVNVILGVEGFVLSEQKQKRQPLCTLVKGNSTKSVGGLFSVSVLDFKITQIERL